MVRTVRPSSVFEMVPALEETGVSVVVRETVAGFEKVPWMVRVMIPSSRAGISNTSSPPTVYLKTTLSPWT